jgi:hypothetical protein
VGSGDPHDWNSFQQYLHIHERCIKNLEHFIIHDGLDLQVADDQILIVGRLLCRCNTFLDVDKTLLHRTDGWVKTIRYSYHAGILLPEPRALFRYDNAHPHPGHPDAHHKHRYDETGAEIKPPISVPWLHLSDAIEELEAWCVAQEADA